MGLFDKTVKHEDLTAVISASGVKATLDDGTCKKYSVDDVLELAYPAIKADMLSNKNPKQ